MFHASRWSCCALLVLIACGEEVQLGGDSADVREEPAPEVPAPEPDRFDLANGAPGYVPFAYPEAPYGTTRGSVIANLEFLGWWSPAVANYDSATTETVRLAEFYDPTGEQGIELVMISAVAVWCGVCRVEYAELRSRRIYEQFRPRGLEMLGILFEDNDANPARYVDLVNWTRTYQVDFPFVIDSGFKSGVYFDRSATPMNMLLDAKTMRILSVVTGYNPEIYDVIDQILTQRGR